MADGRQDPRRSGVQADFIDHLAAAARSHLDPGEDQAAGAARRRCRGGADLLTYTAPKYRIRAHVCGMEYVRPLDPPGEQHHTVCWVQHDFGFAPGSRGKGTTYVLGHSWGAGPSRC